jgi:hypothetical protein
MITINEVKNMLGKKRLELVKVIEQDNEVTEVLLKAGYSSVDGETIHVFGHYNFEDGSTKQSYKEDLLHWFDQTIVDLSANADEEC